MAPGLSLGYPNPASNNPLAQYQRPSLQLGGPAPPPAGNIDSPSHPIDSAYDTYQSGLAAKNAQTQSDISTNAQKGLAQQQFDLEHSTQAQQFGLQQHQNEAKLQADAEARRIQSIPGLLQTFNSSFNKGGGASPQQVDYGGAIAGEDAANSAAYARAKDTAGNQGRAALNALMDVQGARGIVGSGIGANEAGGVIGAANSNLSDVNREQLIQTLAANRARASEQYQGGIAQRGQDVTMRGQNIAAQSAFVNPLLGLVTARY